MKVVIRKLTSTVAKRLSIAFMVFISFPGLAFNQQPPSPSAVAATNTTCCDIAPGGTYEFNQLKITVLATTLDSTGGIPHGTARMRLAQGGATPIDIAAVLGHKTLAMVKRYAHLSESRVRQVLVDMNQRTFG